MLFSSAGARGASAVCRVRGAGVTALSSRRTWGLSLWSSSASCCPVSREVSSTAGSSGVSSISLCVLRASAGLLQELWEWSPASWGQAARGSPEQGFTLVLV